MKNIITGTLALVLFAGISTAEVTSSTTTSQPADTDQNVTVQTTVSGNVEAVDAEARTLTIKGKDGENRRFTVPQQCKIRKYRRFVDLSAVVPGDTVTVICSGKDEIKSMTVQEAQ